MGPLPLWCAPQLFGQPPEFFANATNQWQFAGEGVANFPAQGNDPSCTQPSCNIGLICQVMTDASVGDEVDRLATVAQQQSQWLLPRTALLAQWLRVSEADAARVQDVLDDSWNYQTCTEFAFYQTCETGTQCPFLQGLDTLAREIALCPAQFGIAPERVAENVKVTNQYYGGGDPGSSCVLFVNGEVDPWHSLSILSPPTREIQTEWVLGASHHFWTHPSNPSDQASVVQARKVIQQFVFSALSHSCDQ